MIDISKLSAEEKALVLAKREYHRAWKKKNVDKVEAANRRFYERQAKKYAAEKNDTKK